MKVWSRARALYAGETIGRVLMNEEIARSVHLEGMALDVGGKGYPSYVRLLRRTSSSRFFVLDLIPDRSLNVTGSVTALPVRDESFDVVLCYNVLEHVFDHAAALRELRRVVKPGGELHCRVPFMFAVHGDPFDYWRYTAATLERLLASAGFHNTTVVAHGGLFLVLANTAWPVLRLGILRLGAAGLAWLLDRLLSAVIGAETNETRFPLGYYFIAR